MFTKAGAVFALLVAVLLGVPAVAHAQAAACSEGTYVCDDDAEVHPSTDEQGGGAVTNGGPASAQTDTGAGAAPAPAPAVVEAPSGSLPFTGGDVVGMTVIGAAALGLGTLMVVRSKKSASSAA